MAKPRDRRNTLFRKHPYCFWCSRKVKHPKEFINQDGRIRPGTDVRLMATLDHLDDRLSGRRGQFEGKHQERTVLSCHECNQRRGKEAVAALPKHVLWERCHRPPRAAQLGQSQEMVDSLGIEPRFADSESAVLPN